MTSRTDSEPAADPRWWGPPSAATAAVPVVACGAAALGGLFEALPVYLAGGFVLPLAVVAPGWFLARTARRRRARVRFAVAGCVVAAVYPLLLYQFLWMYFFVMLLTGNGHA
ncbi:hypothetical protein [Streptomyces roseolus]|uniref:hypothetical protein n=1 Tax=Streptomyces roseolus TaxID=67358 RepID=UPI0016774556|nr:hypothetical protein [Streptomyces roseolus]GGR65802.1 hypothetical protein GCM10010282_68570 [Streptomyces roseolus]